MKKYFLFLLIGLLFCSWNAHSMVNISTYEVDNSLPIEIRYQAAADELQRKWDRLLMTKDDMPATENPQTARVETADKLNEELFTEAEEAAALAYINSPQGAADRRRIALGVENYAIKHRNDPEFSLETLDGRIRAANDMFNDPDSYQFIASGNSFDQFAENRTYSKILFDSTYMKDVTVDELKELIAGGESPFISTAEGNTPLHVLAIYNENPEVIKTLINYGVNVNVKDNNGVTPLHRAVVLNPNSAVVEMLIRCGANVNARTEFGVTPLMVVSYKFVEVQNRLSGVKIQTRVPVPYLKNLEILIKQGADVNAKDKFGFTSLMRASMGKDLEAVEVLIKHGADVNARAEFGISALHMALHHAANVLDLNMAIIETLITHGADVNVKAEGPETPLMMLLRGNSVRIPEAVELLIKNGADVKIKDSTGKTALDYYRDNENIKHHPKYWDVLDLMYQKMKEK